MGLWQFTTLQNFKKYRYGQLRRNCGQLRRNDGQLRRNWGGKNGKNMKNLLNHEADEFHHAVYSFLAPSRVHSWGILNLALALCKHSC